MSKEVEVLGLALVLAREIKHYTETYSGDEGDLHKDLTVYLSDFLREKIKRYPSQKDAWIKATKLYMEQFNQTLPGVMATLREAEAEDDG